MNDRKLPPVDELTRAQYDGRACVWCGIPLWKNARPAGRAVGSLGAHVLDIDVYACLGCATSGSRPSPSPVGGGRV